ncbi:Uncharacterised protein [Bordetella pertussis]|nr:Uncharacterised protein [Bordetella pertussis]CFO38218.1 Uncharacterised protein [Bordetella pertussis]CFP02085.1 Uncharacterised protein [Bordetella pertussis]CFP10706.1 Uncharacterised protein [Bordetella pertussis]CFW56992.1 Uncharacterised protein [Bordetella pertussis]
MGALLQLVERQVGILVEPVRGHAFLGDVVHVARAELELHRRAIRTHQRGVQGLVAVDLGDGDVVLELARHGPVQLVQRAQRQVALGQGMDDDAETVDIQDFGKRFLLFGHLAVDAVQRLLAAGHLGLDAGGRQRRAHGVLDLADDFAPVAAGRQHGAIQYLVAVGVHRREAQVLQFAKQQVQAQPVRDRRVDFQGFAGDAAALLGVDRVQRAHVVQAVGQLDQDDAHVARHGQQHLAKALGLLLGLGREVQPVQFGQAVDQFGDFGAEFLGQLMLAHALVFHHVVQQGGRQRIGVQLPAGADFGNGDGVGNVRRAAGAELAQVGLVGEAVGFAHAFDLFGVEVGADDLGQRRQRGDRRGGRVDGFLGAGRRRGRRAAFLTGAPSQAQRGKQS